MRHLRGFGAAFMVCISVGSIAFAASDPLKAELLLRYAAMKKAMAALNGAKIGEVLAPNFVSVDVSGQSEGAAQMIAEVNALKPNPNKSSETTLLAVTRSANVATVKQQYDMKTIKVAADGTPHHFELVTLSTDTWVKPTDIWLIQRTVTNDVKVFTDGKLISHKP